MKTVNIFSKKMLRWSSLWMLVCLLGFSACDSNPRDGGDTGIEEVGEVGEAGDLGYGNDWDTDDDNYIGEREFSEGFMSTNWYDDWDADNDNQLSDTEFNEGYYSIWDANDDNVLTEDEWNVMNDRYDNDMGTFQDWDVNGDNQVDYTEYNDRVGTTTFGAWDRDANGYLSEEEYTGNMFNTWDTNNDNRLDQNEYGAWNDAYNR